MFVPKQSDVFYNEFTDDLFVCIVSAVTAERCEGSTETLSGAVPLVYKIEKETNYKSLIFPENLTSFVTNNHSDLFAVTPTCPTGTDFESISKPFINYNKTQDKYTITFLGRYTLQSEGIGITNFTLQNIDNKFHLLDTHIYLPKSKIRTDSPYTFLSGYLNSDLQIGGNVIRNTSKSNFSTYERPPDYKITPTHVEHNNTLGFNLSLSSSIDPWTVTTFVSGDVNHPVSFNGGYITYNNKYTAFDPNYTIRVDFTARSFQTNTPSAYSSVVSVAGDEASRFVQNFETSGAGEGFCVYFHTASKDPVVPNGVGSTLGYSPGKYNHVEKEGPLQPVSGLVHYSETQGEQDGHVTRQADSYLGVGFDIKGHFLNTNDGKPYVNDDTLPNRTATFTSNPSSVGIRGNAYHNFVSLTSVALTDTPSRDIPLHTGSSGSTAPASTAPFVDYRIDLSNKGNLVTVYSKLTSDTDYNTILQYKLTSCPGYTPWASIYTGAGGTDTTPRLLNVGLSFTTSEYASNFELKSFEVTGVKIKNPFEKVNTTSSDEEDKPTPIQHTDYLDPISKIQRKYGGAFESITSTTRKNKVNITLTTYARGELARSLHEQLIEGNSINDCLPDEEIKEKLVEIQLIDNDLDLYEHNINQVGKGEIPTGTWTINEITTSTGDDNDLDTVEPKVDPITETMPTGKWTKWRYSNRSVLQIPIGSSIKVYGDSGKQSTFETQWNSKRKHPITRDDVGFYCETDFKTSYIPGVLKTPWDEEVESHYWCKHYIDEKEKEAIHTIWYQSSTPISQSNKVGQKSKTWFTKSWLDGDEAAKTREGEIERKLELAFERATGTNFGITDPRNYSAADRIAHVNWILLSGGGTRDGAMVATEAESGSGHIEQDGFIFAPYYQTGDGEATGPNSHLFYDVPPIDACKLPPTRGGNGKDPNPPVDLGKPKGGLNPDLRGEDQPVDQGGTILPPGGGILPPPRKPVTPVIPEKDELPPTES